MTGYGQASDHYGQKKITVEIKSLNGKSSDVRMKIPSFYGEKELELRKMVIEKALRGKMEFVITTESESGEDGFGLNVPLISKYITELKKIQTQFDIPNADILQSVLRIPNIIQAQDGDLEEAEWQKVLELTHKAIDALAAYRKEEGDAMYKDFIQNVDTMEALLADVANYEQARIDKIRARLHNGVLDQMTNDAIDKNRLEQEIVFYIEKLDINEEKVRLAQHCKFFREQLEKEHPIKGKKLGFISQEMGREINTLGAKAQDSSIQQLVVGMKDELEKIKEQVLNIV